MEMRPGREIMLFSSNRFRKFYALQESIGNAVGDGRVSGARHIRKSWPGGCRGLQKHTLDPAIVGVGNVLLHPVYAQYMLGDFNHDVVSGGAAVVVKARQTLQA